MILKRFFSAVLLLVTVTSCTHDPLNIAPNKLDQEIAVVNLDSLIYKSDLTEFAKQQSELKLRLGELYDYQIGYCMSIQSPDDSVVLSGLADYRKDPMIQELEQSIADQFPSVETHASKIKEGFAYLATHLPKAKIPYELVFMNSLFRSSAFATDSALGIGLERYLGPENDLVKQLPNEPFYQWIKDGMLSKYLERDAITAWNMTNTVPEIEGTLAEQIVRWGKLIYLTEAAFPNDPEAIILRYSEEDYKWALENEYALWKYLVDEKLLFSNDERTIANLLNDGPFTPGLPETGPDRLGQFLGWRMVHSYMESNSDITVEEMIAKPYNEILQAYEIE